MLATSYDSKRLINVSLHLGEPLTDADVDGMIGTIDSMAQAVASSHDAFRDPMVHAAERAQQAGDVRDVRRGAAVAHRADRAFRRGFRRDARRGPLARRGVAEARRLTKR